MLLRFAVAHGQEMTVGRAAQLIAYLERRRFWALDAHRVDAVDHFDFARLAQFTDNAQGRVKIPLHRQGGGTVHERLGQFAQGNLAVRQQHDAFRPRKTRAA